MSSTNGPKQIGDALGGLDGTLARLKAGTEQRHRKRVEAEARPGELFAQAESRLRAEDAAKEREATQEKERQQAAAIPAKADHMVAVEYRMAGKVIAPSTA